ncbi:serine/threonine-protein kinase [Solwaraspora sp. WMMB335]|uniref:serine/threonine-protein kinase n=1 Tax=Solwaraspora sp. WMMB335 TaxID=3404118 RepID=UPI003B962F29
MASLHAGELLARRYRLIDRIGAGGMSVIWRARDEVLDRVVAVKVLAASLSADARFRGMVREEARSAAQLIHPHVTAVHDYGESVAPDGTVTAFVVMELLSGEELDARLTAGPLPWPQAVEICAQAAEALAAAHRLGIVHRDVTPANIMMTLVGAKVLDFGIATQIGAPDEDEDGETFGTPAYVAPERLDGRPAQPATDVYSLGVLLYETLTGRVPYPADTWEDLHRALDQEIPPLVVPGLPGPVVEVCLRCLSRDPLDRPTAHQVGVALRDQLLPADPQAATMLSPTVTLPTVVPDLPAGSSAAAGTGPGGSVAGGSVAGGSVAGTGERRGDAGGRRGMGSPRFAALVAASAATVALVAVVLLLRPWAGEMPLVAGPSPTGSPVPPASPPATPPAASVGPTAGDTASAGVPVPSITTVAPTTALPTVPTVDDAIVLIGQVIDDGIAEGAIRRDAGLDLQNLLRNLQTSLTSGSADIEREVDQMRQKVGIRANEGAITYAYARELGAALDLLAGAAT